MGEEAEAVQEGERKLPRFDWGKMKWRLNRSPPQRKRFPTKHSSFDRWMGGGLPRGLSVLYGEGGSGKTKLAHHIALKAENALYLAGEVINDAPDPRQFPNVNVMDYTSSRPRWDTMLAHIRTAVDKLEPDLLVLDSLSTIFDVTNKALPESDLRKSIGMVHREYEGKLPVIGVSEVRGTGYYQSTAGGEGVRHGCTLLVHFQHVFADNGPTAESMGISIGDDIFTIRVVKDKHNVASTKRGKISYVDGEITIEPVKPRGGIAGFKPSFGQQKNGNAAQSQPKQTSKETSDWDDEPKKSGGMKVVKKDDWDDDKKSDDGW